MMMCSILKNETEIFFGTLQDCRTNLIIKARIAAGMDQYKYEGYVNDIVENNKLETSKDNFIIKQKNSNEGKVN